MPARQQTRLIARAAHVVEQYRTRARPEERPRELRRIVHRAVLVAERPTRNVRLFVSPIVVADRSPLPAVVELEPTLVRRPPPHHAQRPRGQPGAPRARLRPLTLALGIDRAHLHLVGHALAKTGNHRAHPRMALRTVGPVPARAAPVPYVVARNLRATGVRRRRPHHRQPRHAPRRRPDRRRRRGERRLVHVRDLDRHLHRRRAVVAVVAVVGRHRQRVARLRFMVVAHARPAPELAGGGVDGERGAVGAFQAVGQGVVVGVGRGKGRAEVHDGVLGGDRIAHALVETARLAGVGECRRGVRRRVVRHRQVQRAAVHETPVEAGHGPSVEYFIDIGPCGAKGKGQIADMEDQAGFFLVGQRAVPADPEPKLSGALRIRSLKPKRRRSGDLVVVLPDFDRYIGKRAIGQMGARKNKQANPILASHRDRTGPDLPSPREVGRQAGYGRRRSRHADRRAGVPADLRAHLERISLAVGQSGHAFPPITTGPAPLGWEPTRALRHRGAQRMTELIRA